MTYYSTTDNSREKIYFAIAAISIGISAALLKMNLQTIEKYIIPSGFLIYGILILLFNHFLWKWWPFRIFVNVPNLNGEWEGLNSKDDKTQEKMYITISQTWTKIDIVCEAQYTSSHVIAANLNNDNSKNYILKYIYQVRSTADDNINRFGEGCHELVYKKRDKLITLDGRYFSSKFNGGRIIMTKLQIASNSRFKKWLKLL